MNAPVLSVRFSVDWGPIDNRLPPETDVPPIPSGLLIHLAGKRIGGSVSTNRRDPS